MLELKRYCDREQLSLSTKTDCELWLICSVFFTPSNQCVCVCTWSQWVDEHDWQDSSQGQVAVSSWYCSSVWTRKDSSQKINRSTLVTVISPEDSPFRTTLSSVRAGVPITSGGFFTSQKKVPLSLNWARLSCMEASFLLMSPTNCTLSLNSSGPGNPFPLEK